MNANATFQIVAVTISAMMLLLPVSGATQVNIFFNGVVQETVDISPHNLVNRQLSVIHDPNDITWSNVKILATVNSGSLGHTVERIFLFKCGLLDPVACSTVAPIDFEGFADTELLWSDVSEQEGAGTYPQTAHLLIMVKVVDDTGQTSWIGFWDRITRTDFNIFTMFNFDLDTVDLVVNDADFITPTANFIENYQMIPFKWTEEMSFNVAPLHALGGDEAELNVPVVTAASPQGDTIDQISKDFFLVSGDGTSGLTNFITLNKNPSFTCGDGICDSNLGESSSSCCFDCGCSTGSYCDVAEQSQPEDGVCRTTDGITISVIAPTLPEVTDCTQPISFDLNYQINNLPASLPTNLQSIITLNGVPQSINCEGSNGLFTCPLQVQPTVSCGAGSFTITDNELNVTLSFNDGGAPALLPLSEEIPDINVAFNCGCPDGFFCDSGPLVCQPEASVSLSVLNVTSFLPNFDPSGDVIELTVKINNPPTDLGVSGVTYTLGTLFRDDDPVLNSTTGSITCSGGEGHLYYCEIPVSISGYDHNFAYYFRQNSITFTVSYSDVDLQVVADLTSAFADVTIPSFQCGDNVCNVEESQTNCCVDCGCPQSGMYCDNGVQSCDFLSSIDLAVLDVAPTHLTDCQPAQPHVVEVTAQVENPPSDLSLDFVFYLQNGVVENFPVSCEQINPGANTGLFNCQITLPALSECQQSPGDYTLGPNELNFTISFNDGNNGVVTRSMSSGFDSLVITPIYKPLDGLCESHLGENAGNSCVDCPCEDDVNFGDAYYCGIQGPGDGGACKPKSDIRLVVDSPTQQVKFDSCERSHDLEIKAHIENTPPNLLGITFNGVVDGENAEFLSCRQGDFFPSENVSAPIECTLRISSVPDCSKGDIIIYEPNSLSATIAFQDGLSSSAVVTVTDDLPPIKLTQSILSIFDITQDAFEDISREVERTKDIVQEMLDFLDTCLEVALMLAIVSIAAVVAGGIVGGYTGDGDGFSGSGWSRGVEAGAHIGQGLFEMWIAYCNFVQNYLQVQLQMQQVQIQFRQSQLCMDLVQHELDLGDEGNCYKQEQSCFNQLVSCLNFANINSAMGQVNQFMGQAHQSALQFGDGLQTFGDGLSDLNFGGSSGDAILTVKYNQNQPHENACNRMSGLQGTYNYQSCGGQGNRDDLFIIVEAGSGCQYPVVRESGPFCEGASCRGQQFNIDRYTSQTDLSFELYCFDDVSEKNENLDQLIPGSSFYITAVPVTVRVDPDGCDCGIGAGSGTGSGSTGPVTLEPVESTITSGSTVEFTATLDANDPSTSPWQYRFDWNNDGIADKTMESTERYVTTESVSFTQDSTVVVHISKILDAGGTDFLGVATAQVTVTAAGNSGGSTCGNGVWDIGDPTNEQCDLSVSSPVPIAQCQSSQNDPDGDFFWTCTDQCLCVPAASELKITFPENGDGIPQSNFPLVIEGTLSNPEIVTSLKLSIPEKPFEHLITPVSGNWNLPVTFNEEYAPGDYTILVEARDVDGGLIVTHSIGITIIGT